MFILNDKKLMLRVFLMLSPLFAFPVAASGVIPAGALGNGLADDTSAIQTAIDKNLSIWLEPGKTYRISQALRISKGVTIESDGTATLLLGVREGEIGNVINRQANGVRDCKIDFNNMHHIGIDITGSRTGIVNIKNIRIVREHIDGDTHSDDHYIHGINIRNSSGVDILNNTFMGFSEGYIIAVDSSEDVQILGNAISGSLTNTECQHTAISIDDNRVNINGAIKDSDNIKIRNNLISDLVVSDALRSKNKYETDGINIQGTGATNVIISDNTIRNVGEGIDVFSNGGLISNNRIYNAFIFGIKLVHGASGWTVSNNYIYRAGLSGINLSGSGSTGAGHTENNRVVKNTVVETGYSSAWSHVASWGPASISLLNNGDTGFVKSNLIDSNTLNLNSNTKYGVYCDPANKVQEKNIISNLDFDSPDWTVEGVRDCPVAEVRK